MKPKHPCSVQRDAIMLAAIRHPFIRWEQHTFAQRAEFTKEATNIRKHLADNEPLAFID